METNLILSKHLQRENCGLSLTCWVKENRRECFIISLKKLADNLYSYLQKQGVSTAQVVKGNCFVWQNTLIAVCACRTREGVSCELTGQINYFHFSNNCASLGKKKLRQERLVLLETPQYSVAELQQSKDALETAGFKWIS